MPRRRQPDPDEHDPELDSCLAALAPPLDDTGAFGSAQVSRLRLPAVRVEQLRRIAQDRGVSPGAPALDRVVERSTARTPPPARSPSSRRPSAVGVAR